MSYVVAAPPGNVEAVRAYKHIPLPLLLMDDLPNAFMLCVKNLYYLSIFQLCDLNVAA